MSLPLSQIHQYQLNAYLVNDYTKLIVKHRETLCWHIIVTNFKCGYNIATKFKTQKCIEECSHSCGYRITSSITILYSHWNSPSPHEKLIFTVFVEEPTIPHKSLVRKLHCWVSPGTNIDNEIHFCETCLNIEVHPTLIFNKGIQE